MAVSIDRSSKENFNRQQNLFISAITLGRDYIEATDTLPTRQAFNNLYLNGCIDHPPEEIESIFYDWEDFQSFSQQEYHAYTEAKESEKQALLQAIELDQQLGVLHPLLFKKIWRAKSKEHQEQERKGTDLRLPINLEVNDDEKIRRYIKFKIVERLTDNLDSEESQLHRRTTQTPFDRRTSIALGYNINTFKVFSSFEAEIGKSTSPDMTTGAARVLVEEAALLNGWTDYLEIDLRTNYLREIIESSSKAPQPDKKNLETLLPISQDFSKNKIEVEYYVDSLSEKILIGRAAVNDYLESGGHPMDLLPLGEFLRNSRPVNSNRSERLNSRKWLREDYLNFGKWVVSILPPSSDPRLKDLTEKVLINANRIGIGFSIGPNTRFENYFGTLGNYYSELGISRTHRPNYSKNLRIDSAAHAVVSLAKALQRRPTWYDLIEAHSQNPSIPHPQKLNEAFSNEDKSGFTLVMEAAGYGPRRKALDANGCLEWGLDFFKEHRRVPKETDIDGASKNGEIPSRRKFREFFGGTKAFQIEVEGLHSRLDNSSDLDLLAA